MCKLYYNGPLCNFMALNYSFVPKIILLKLVANAFNSRTISVGVTGSIGN